MAIDLMKDVKKNNWPNRIFFIVFGLLLIGSVAFTYFRIVVKRDYMISAETDCDPYAEECFIYECDPNTEECTGDPEEDTWYYKIIKRKAYNIPLCDPNDESCEALVCPEEEEECSYELCEEGNEEGIECVDPEQYAIDNPEEEEEEDCEEGDEECLNEESECEEGDEECLSEEETECEEGDEECLGEEESADEEKTECDAAAEDCGDDNTSESEAGETAPETEE